MGDFQPDAHVNGLEGWSFTALTDRSFWAVSFWSVFIILFLLVAKVVIFGEIAKVLEDVLILPIAHYVETVKFEKTDW